MKSRGIVFASLAVSALLLAAQPAASQGFFDRGKELLKGLGGSDSSTGGGKSVV